MAKEQVLSLIMAAALCPFVPNLISLEFREGSREENWSTDYQTWNKTSWSKWSINSRRWLIYLKSLMSRMASVSGSNWQERMCFQVWKLWFVVITEWEGFSLNSWAALPPKHSTTAKQNHGNSCDAPEERKCSPAMGSYRWWLSFIIESNTLDVLFLLQFWASPGSLQDPQ